jgi:sugar (pentulose or hexulose) kinase
LYPDYPTAIAAMTRVGRVFMPNPEAQRTYQQLYTQVYQRMYKQLRPLYQTIRKITGYPA